MTVGGAACREVAVLAAVDHTVAAAQRLAIRAAGIVPFVVVAIPTGVAAFARIDAAVAAHGDVRSAVVATRSPFGPGVCTAHAAGAGRGAGF